MGFLLNVPNVIVYLYRILLYSPVCVCVSDWWMAKVKEPNSKANQLIKVVSVSVDIILLILTVSTSMYHIQKCGNFEWFVKYHRFNMIMLVLWALQLPQ